MVASSSEGVGPNLVLMWYMPRQVTCMSAYTYHEIEEAHDLSTSPRA
jgi:hypothetical protein